MRTIWKEKLEYHIYQCNWAWNNFLCCFCPFQSITQKPYEQRTIMGSATWLRLAKAVFSHSMPDFTLTNRFVKQTSSTGRASTLASALIIICLPGNSCPACVTPVASSDKEIQPWEMFPLFMWPLPFLFNPVLSALFSSKLDKNAVSLNKRYRITRAVSVWNFPHILCSFKLKSQILPEASLYRR